VFHGSMGGQHLNQPIVALGATPDGGYYEIASDGGIFSFGPGAVFHGSRQGLPLNQLADAFIVVPGGYYEVTMDGGVFAFGGAVFDGSLGGFGVSNVVAASLAAPPTSGARLSSAATLSVSVRCSAPPLVGRPPSCSVLDVLTAI
jgi:hypothetical protein